MACSTNAKKHVFIHFNGKALNREEEDDGDDNCLIQQFWSNTDISKLDETCSENNNHLVFVRCRFFSSLQTPNVPDQ